MFRGKLGADLLAIGRGLGVGASASASASGAQTGAPVCGETRRADPAFLDRRIDIGRVGCRAGHAREAIRAVVRHRDGAGFLAELHERPVAQREPRLIEGVERLEDQQRHRLAEIERRLADRAEQIAGIELGNAGADLREIGRRHHHRRLERAAQPREVDAGVDMRRVRRPDQHGVRGLRRPARKIGGAKIGRVELGAGDLGDAVDAAGAGGGRIPALPSGQRLARREGGFLGRCQARQAERNAARRDRLHELASRRPHALTSRSALRMLCRSQLRRAHSPTFLNRTRSIRRCVRSLSTPRANS